MIPKALATGVTTEESPLFTFIVVFVRAVADPGDRVGLELTKAYLHRGWRVIAAVRDPSTMPHLDGEMVVLKFDVGEKGDAKKASLAQILYHHEITQYMSVD